LEPEGQIIEQYFEVLRNLSSREAQMAEKLYRSRDRKIAGVCSGLADYFDVDPTLMRVIALFFLFWGGAGGLAYIIAWFMIPNAPEKVT